MARESEPRGIRCDCNSQTSPGNFGATKSISGDPGDSYEILTITKQISHDTARLGDEKTADPDHISRSQISLIQPHVRTAGLPAYWQTELMNISRGR
jgi:hypothetical protein